MEAVLDAKGVWEHISSGHDEDGPQAGVVMKKSKARALIFCSLTPQYVAMVLSEKDPKVM